MANLINLGGDPMGTSLTPRSYRGDGKEIENPSSNPQAPQTLKKAFRTHDEEWMPGRRIATEIEQFLDTVPMDTVNEEYAVVVEVIKL